MYGSTRSRNFATLMLLSLVASCVSLLILDVVIVCFSNYWANIALFQIKNKFMKFFFGCLQAIIQKLDKSLTSYNHDCSR